MSLLPSLRFAAGKAVIRPQAGRCRCGQPLGSGSKQLTLVPVRAPMADASARALDGKQLRGTHPCGPAPRPAPPPTCARQEVPCDSYNDPREAQAVLPHRCPIAAVSSAAYCT